MNIMEKAATATPAAQVSALTETEDAPLAPALAEAEPVVLAAAEVAEPVLLDVTLELEEAAVVLLGQPGIGACVLYLLKWSFSDIGVRKIVVSDLLSSEKTYSWERHHLLTYVNAALRVSTSRSLSY